MKGLRTSPQSPSSLVPLLFSCLVWGSACSSLTLLALAEASPVQKGSRVENSIEEIRIVGNRRILESTIRYYIQSRERGEFSLTQVRRDYRSLLNTNFFQDAKVFRQQGETGVIVIFEVKERPLIRSIEYEGLKAAKESDVLERFREERVGLTVDSPFDEAKVSKAEKTLTKLLAANGRPLGRVDTEIEEVTSYAVKLTFLIDEGPKVRIGEIQIEGNSVFTDDELRGALELTKERGPVTLFKGYDKYIKEKLEYDVQVNMLAQYREHGYMDARAGEPKEEIVEAGQGWLLGFRKTKQQYYITIPIEEGAQYHWEKFEIEGVENFNQQALQEGYRISPGDVVNYTRLKENNDELKKLYSRFGYLDMEIIPELKLDRETQTLEATLRVTEGKQYIVNRITFEGNSKTRDKVLRREFLIGEQQAFNGDLLDYSVTRLNQLGFFERLEEKDYEIIKRPRQSEVDVLVTVKERSQQSIGFTAGVSGISGSFVGINYQSNNFRGLGQQVQVNMMTGTRSSNYMFAFTEPYFMDTRVSLGWSIFNQRYRFDTFTAFFGLISPSENIPLYTRTSVGGSVEASYPIWRWTKVGLGYTLSTIRIEDIDPLFSDFATNQLVGFTPGGNPEDALKGIIRSEIRPSFVYNTKDSFYGARRGSQFFARLPISGGILGGSFNVIRPSVEYQKFIPDRFLSGGRHTFAFRARFIHLIPYGNLPGGDPMAVPFFERIFSGGEFSLRGFDIRSVSPWAVTRSPRLDSNQNPIVDPATGLPAISDNLIPTGGDAELILTAEYRVPIAGPLQVTAFGDLGTSTVLKKGNLQLFGPNTFIQLLENTNNVWRGSTGAEVQFIMPMVNQPFRLIFAYNPLILDTEVVVGGIRFPLREPKRNIKFSVGYSF